ncbi:hypothetical protein Holit_00126 [Hollandina sp. SP2]
MVRQILSLPLAPEDARLIDLDISVSSNETRWETQVCWIGWSIFLPVHTDEA